MTDSTYHANPWKLHLQKLAIELTCPHCLKLINEPVGFPCHHMFCKSCILQLSQVTYECLVCKSLFSNQDIRAAPYLENMITIYKSMEATLNARFEATPLANKYLKETGQVHLVTNSGCSPCISFVAPKIDHGDGKKESIAPQLSSCSRTRNMNMINQASIGSPPGFTVTNGLGDGSINHKNEQVLEPIAVAVLERNESVTSRTEEHHVRVLKRQRKMGDGFLVKSGKTDSHCHIVGSNFVESLVDCTGLDSYGEDETICAFCQSSKVSEESGSMLHFANGKQVVGDEISYSNVIHVHTQCLEWAPQVFYTGEILQNLEAEVARGAKLKCSRCGFKGAALGCYEKKCRKTYHVPCAVEVVGCRWDWDNYLVLCPSHFSSKFPNEKFAPQKRHFHTEPMSAPMTTDQVKFWEASPLGGKEWVICGSSLSAKEKFLLIKFASMSGITVSKFWKANVTHIIAATDLNGVCCRTLKVLMGILHGKWILKIDWIRACMDVMHPVDEEPYEISTDNYGSCDGPRTGRLRILTNEPKLLNDFHFYFSKGFLLEYMSILQNLVIAAGGTVLNSREKVFTQARKDPSTILIVYNVDAPQGCKLGEEISLVLKRLQAAQELAEKTGSRIIQHTWLLESVAAYQLQNFGS